MKFFYLFISGRGGIWAKGENYEQARGGCVVVVVAVCVNVCVCGFAPAARRRHKQLGPCRVAFVFVGLG